MKEELFPELTQGWEVYVPNSQREKISQYRGCWVESSEGYHTSSETKLALD